MSELDKRLEELTDGVYVMDRGIVLSQDEVISRIKQAFQEAGYRVCLRNGELSKHMTGQEWLNRFEASAPKQLTEADELDFNLHDDDPVGNCYYAYNCAISDMKRAARRVAGIEEEKEAK